MSRRKAAVKRVVLADPIYNSTVVTKLINQVMLDGKRSVAEKIVYDAMTAAAEKLSVEPMVALTNALENVMPVLETKARRVGGANYQVPMEIKPERRQTLGIRFLVEYSRKRTGERGMSNKLAAEIVDACNSTGGAVKKKDDMHRQAEANKAFAHYRY
jgi:small subunit ribosomal protein S7